MTPCPSPGPPGSPGHPGRGRTGTLERTERKKEVKHPAPSPQPSYLVRVHEEFNKLTSHHSQLSRFEVIQRQPRVQFTAGLVKVQQPAHKPESQTNTGSQCEKTTFKRWMLPSLGLTCAYAHLCCS